MTSEAEPRLGFAKAGVDRCGLCRRVAELVATAQVSLVPFVGEGRGVRLVLFTVCARCARRVAGVADQLASEARS